MDSPIPQNPPALPPPSDNSAPNPIQSKKGRKLWGRDIPPPKSPGRPKGSKRPITTAYQFASDAPCADIFRKALKKIGIDLPADATNADAMAFSMMYQGVKGSVPAAKEVREAIEGKSPQRVEILNPEDRAKTEITLTFKRAEVSNPDALKTVMETELTVKKKAELPAEVNEAIVELIHQDDESTE